MSVRSGWESFLDGLNLRLHRRPTLDYRVPVAALGAGAIATLIYGVSTHSGWSLAFDLVASAVALGICTIVVVAWQREA